MKFDASKIKVNIGCKFLIIAIWEKQKMLVFILLKPVVEEVR